MKRKVLNLKQKLIFLMAAMLFTYANAIAATSHTGMRGITTMQLTADMGKGWNLGNTLDAHGDWANGLETETMWSNPYTTQAMLDMVAAKGFKTVRIPVTWYKHIGGAPNYTIDAAWLNRVEQVVNYAFENNMYVILNTHHEEDHWLQPTYANEAAATNQLKQIWTQLANRFKDYGDYLIFETINEPRLQGSPNEWNGGDYEGRTVVNNFNKAAVDAIRATGGNNSGRFIMCPTYAASSADDAINGWVKPNNDINVLASIHSYFPYSFCGQPIAQGGTAQWGSQQDKQGIDNEMAKLKRRYIDNGIAVVMGEWGSMDRGNTSARTTHAAYYVQKAKENGIATVLWDDGGDAGDFRQLNRFDLNWFFSAEIINAIVQPAGDNLITSITAPQSVKVGSSVNVIVNYTASASRDIVVSFQLDTDPWTNYESVTKTVGAGSGSLSFSLPIPANVPVADDAYQIQTIITTTGGGWNEHFDNKAETNVNATTDVATDEIATITAPSSVEVGKTASISVNYTASTTRDVKVTFQLDDSPWTSYAEETQTVSAGSGTLSFDLAIPADVPVAQAAYQFQVIITTPGGGWNERLANLAEADVNATGLSGTDEIIAIAVPNSVQVGSIASLSVNYSATANCDVRVSFELDESPWTAFISEAKNVNAGTGILNFDLNIPTNVPVVNDAYQFQVIITSTGGGWNERFDNKSQANVSATGGSNSSVFQLTKRNAQGFAIDGGFNGADYQNVYLWSGDANNENQQWEEIDRGAGYYSYKKANTNFCLDGGNGGANDQNVALMTCNNTNENQQWRKVSAGGSYYRLEKRNAPGFSIDGGNGGANNQNLKLWSSDHSNENQHWLFNTPTTKSAKMATNITTVETKTFSVYPNPASHIVNIKLNTEELSTIQIFDVYGRLVLSQVTDQNELLIQTSEIGSHGIYFIRTNNETKRLIIE